MARTYESSTGKKTNEESTHKHKLMALSWVINGSWTQKKGSWRWTG